MIKIFPKLVHKDERGLIETINSDKEWKEINRFVSESDVIRGKHYHKNTEELIFILEGKIEIEIKDMKTGKVKKEVIKEGEGILIEPYEMHTVRVLKKTVWFSFLTQKYNKNNPDIFDK